MNVCCYELKLNDQKKKKKMNEWEIAILSLVQFKTKKKNIFVSSNDE